MIHSGSHRLGHYIIHKTAMVKFEKYILDTMN